MKSNAKKAVSNAVQEKAEEALTELNNCPNWMFRLVKGLNIDSKEVDGGSDGKLCFCVRRKRESVEGLNGKDHEWGKRLGS